MERKVIYYKDELNDEFSEAKIVPRKIDENYVYIHKNPLWNIASYILQNILSMPIKLIYAKCKLGIKYIGKEKFKKARKTGYFIYANHTQSFADTFIPSLANYPKRNFFIVNPENVSMKFLKHTVEMLGALPIPSDKKGMVHFLEAIKNNVFGTYNVANCADKYGSKKMILISTDKAVNPTNIMGATKRLCEMIIQVKNKNSKTEYAAVRFGNVLGLLPRGHVVSELPNIFRRSSINARLIGLV